MKAVAPNGSQIIGTLDMVSVRANIQTDSFVREPDGSLKFEWAGDSTVFWDDQKTVERNGQTVYLAYDGGEWTADQILLLNEDDKITEPQPTNPHLQTGR